MRTTIDLGDDLVREIKRQAASKNVSFREIVEKSLLSVFFPKRKNLRKFCITPYSSPFRSGIDEERLSELSEELQNEDDLEELSK